MSYLKNALIEYIFVKVAEEDWHAVSDAANDLRVLEATKACTGCGSDKCCQQPRERKKSRVR